jgi:hypothetical protein
VDRPGYSYGIYNAAIQAKSLGHSTMGILEFGVAQGNGIKVMQKICKEISKEINVNFAIYGFDGASGLPESHNLKDQIYFWRENMFSNNNKNYSNIENHITKIIIGSVESTSVNFIEVHKPPVIGFVAFDLDYYTSTKAAFSLFNKININNFLPRVECFMDDTASFNYLSASSHTGVLLAINEFNQQDSDIQILQKVGIGRSRKQLSGWFDACFVLHNFNHDKYNEFIKA